MAERQAREVAKQQQARKARKLQATLEGLGTLTPGQHRGDLVAFETDMACATQRLGSLQEDSTQRGSSSELLPRGDSGARGQDGGQGD